MLLDHAEGLTGQGVVFFEEMVMEGFELAAQFGQAAVARSAFVAVAQPGACGGIVFPQGIFVGGDFFTDFFFQFTNDAGESRIDGQARSGLFLMCGFR